MGKISTEILKSSFSKKDASQYKLSVLSGADSLSYCITASDGEVLSLKKFDFLTRLESLVALPNKLDEIWEREAQLTWPFQSVSLSVISPLFTLVPNRLFKKEEKEHYLKPLKRPNAASEVYLINNLQIAKAQLVFSLPEALINFFNEKYAGKAMIYNSIGALINAYARQMNGLSGKQVWINVHTNLLQIVLFNNKEVIFSNQFRFESEKDFLYFVLLVYNQFKLDPKQIPLHISGQLVKESAIYKAIYRYVKNISFIRLADFHKLNAHLVNNPVYFFFDLLSLNN